METNPYAAPSAPLEAVPRSGDAPVRVGFWPRVGAAMIDGIIVIAVGAVISGLFAPMFPDYLAMLWADTYGKVGPKVVTDEPSAVKLTRVMHRWGVGVGLFGLVYSLAEGLTGRALGKLLLGLRIAGIDGRPAPLRRLLARVALKQSDRVVTVLCMFTAIQALTTIASVLAGATILGFLLVIHRRRQALHDLATRTAVYHNTDVAAVG
jgi:uncharacterized RDD family membrane protein YckC